MADDHWTTWQAEYAGTNRLPTIWSAFLLFGLLALALLSLLGGPDAVAEQANRDKPATLCQEHAGRPGWDAICQEAARR